jgi:hypothetical protein
MPPVSNSSPPVPAKTPAPRPGPLLPWWQRAAARLALASGVFSLVIAVALVANLVTYHQSGNPLTSRELVTMKSELVKNPQNDKLKGEIRALDLRLRTAHDRYVMRLHRSQWLLFAGMAVFIGSVQAAVWRKKIAKPGKVQKTPGWQARETWQASLSVGVLGALVGAGAWWLAATTGTELKVAGPAVASGTNAVGTNVAVAVAAAAPPLPPPEEFLRQWPRFRGPRGDGVAFVTNAPVAWNIETGEGVLWKAAVPLPSPSSPGFS